MEAGVKKSMGAVDPRPVSRGRRWRRRLPLAHPSPEEGGECDDRDDDQDTRDDEDRVLTPGSNGFDPELAEIVMLPHTFVSNRDR